MIKNLEFGISQDISTLLLAIITFIAFIFSIYSFKYSRKYIEFNLKVTYKSEILVWYSDTIKILKEIIALLNYKEFDNKEKEMLLAELSAQIEKGRVYFPNHSIEGQEERKKVKPILYQGKRPLILDYLVFYYALFKYKVDENSSKEEKLNAIKRLKKMQKGFSNIFIMGEYERDKYYKNLIEYKVFTDERKELSYDVEDLNNYLEKEDIYS